MIVEHKFIHSCALRGRIEDVVVLDSYRGKGLGQMIVAACTELSKKLGCYQKAWQFVNHVTDVF